MTTASLAAWRQPRVATAVAVVAGLITGIVLAVTLGGLPWRDYLHRHPPTVVALAFLAPAALPTATSPVGGVRFSFTVVNRRQQALITSYTTSVTDTATHISRSVNHGRASIATGATGTMSQQLTIPDSRAGGRYEVTVRLNTGQSIDFYITSPRANPAKAQQK